MTKHYVIIKPFSQPSAQVRALTVTSPEGTKSTSVSKPKSITFFSILRNGDTGLLNSGLEYDVPNPYKSKTAKDAKLPTNWRGTDIWKRDYISKATELEVKYNKPEGYLTNVPARNIKDPSTWRNTKLNYIESFSWRLENGENLIPLDTLDGEIMYEAAKASALIASSFDDQSAFSRFYIAEVNEEEQKKALKRRTLNKAVAKLEDLYEESSPETLHKFAVLLGVTKGLDKLPHLVVYTKISDALLDATKGERNIRSFEDIYEMYKDNLRLFEGKFLLREMVAFNVIDEVKGAFYWKIKQGTSLHELGKTEDVTVAWLLDLENEPYVKELKHELKVKKNDY